MNFPSISAALIDEPRRGPADALPSPVSLAGTAAGDAHTQDMWQYFVDHIDEFPVAKAIVDHFDARPGDLHSPQVEVDVFALYLRARITLKREAVSYAVAQAELQRVREQSRGLLPQVRAVARHLDELRHALAAQPAVLVAMVGVASLVACR